MTEKQFNAAPLRSNYEFKITLINCIVNQLKYHRKLTCSATENKTIAAASNKELTATETSEPILHYFFPIPC
jgi:hypothetical protein